MVIKTDKKRSLAYLCALGASLIIGFSFMFVSVSLRFSNVIDALSYRFFVAFVFMLILKFGGVLKLDLKVGEIWRFFWLGALYPCAFFMFQAFGLERASSVEAGIITSLAPIFTLIFAMVFLGERSNLAQLFFICLSVFGVIGIFLFKFHENSVFGAKNLDELSLVGVFLLFVSVLSISGYNVVLKHYVQKFEIPKIVFALSIIGFVVFAGLSLVTHAIYGGFGEFFGLFFNLKFMLCSIYLGLFANLLTIFLFSYALKYIEAFRVGIFGNLSTLTAIMAGFFILNEPFGVEQGAVAVMIMLCVIGLNLSKGKI